MTMAGHAQTQPPRDLVVGLGSPDRGDDAVGRVVARAAAALDLAGVRVVEHEDPTSLADLWEGCRLAVVVDAVRTGAPAGSLVRIATSRTGEPLPATAWASTGLGGTHAFGLGASIELCRTLGRLPERLVVVGVEAEGFGYGEPLSVAVAAAVPGALDAVVAELVDAGSRGVPTHVPR